MSYYGAADACLRRHRRAPSLFPDYQSIVKRANALWVILMAAPLAYVLTPVAVIDNYCISCLRSEGVLTNLNADSLRLLLLALSVTGAFAIGVIAYAQTSTRFLASIQKRDPIRRAFLVFSFSSILSEAIATYGLIPTLLSGSLLYVIGFSSVSWILLVWVRTRLVPRT